MLCTYTEAEEQKPRHSKCPNESVTTSIHVYGKKGGVISETNGAWSRNEEYLHISNPQCPEAVKKMDACESELLSALRAVSVVELTGLQLNQIRLET